MIILSLVLNGILLGYCVILSVVFRRLRKDMGILERICTPIIELIHRQSSHLEQQGYIPGKSLLSQQPKQHS